jgi:hypothetical protein
MASRIAEAQAAIARYTQLLNEIIAFDAPSADGSPLRARYVTVFRDSGPGQTGFELHTAR